jgi:acyl-CoA thioesterase-1
MISTLREPFWIHFFALRTSITLKFLQVPQSHRSSSFASYTIPVDVRRTFIVSFFILLFACPLLAADRPLLVCYGDSITAGYGLQLEQAYPAALQRDLDRAGYHYKVDNQGTSGATTKDAAAGTQSILAMRPEIVIVEFGGNDGLRGLPLTETRRNLDAVLSSLEKAHIRILLAGITLPPNYGPEYIQQFEKVFRDLAAKHPVAFVPMIYKDLVNVPGTIQPDGIHPTAKGSEIVARTLFAALTPLLHKSR